MKCKSLGVLILSVLGFSLCIPAYAADTTSYVLDELGMTVSIPSDYIVFTRDVNADDPNLSAYGFTKDSLSSYMDENNVYLYGWDKNANQCFIITMGDSTLGDLNLYSDNTISAMLKSDESQYEDNGLTIISSEIYQHSQAKFQKLYISQSDENSTSYGLQYHTIYADKGINITMMSYLGKITSAQEATLKSMVDSITFDTAPQTAWPTDTLTNSFTYADPKTQATFTVPENWFETPLSEDQEYIGAQLFLSLKDDEVSVVYKSIDAWNEMTESQRKGHIRSDADNSMITKSKIADTLGLPNDSISLVTYGGKEYYKAVVPAGTEVNGITSQVTVTQMMLVNNGYIYLFEFIGASESEYYKDFESVLTNVDIPDYDYQASSANSGSNGLMKRLYGNLLFSLLITIAVYSLPIIIYRFAIRRAPVERKKAKKITIIYGVCAVIVMAVIIAVFSEGGKVGGAVAFWSYINYLILVSGKRPDAAKVSLVTETSPNEYSENTERY